MTKYKIGQKVECTWGSNKGKLFMVVAYLKNGSYSLKALPDDGKIYGYGDGELKEA